MRSKGMIWLFLIAGVLWVLVGLRDALAPGFFSFAGRVVTASNIVADFSIAVVFLTVAGYFATRMRSLE